MEEGWREGRGREGGWEEGREGGRMGIGKRKMIKFALNCLFYIKKKHAN